MKKFFLLLATISLLFAACDNKESKVDAPLVSLSKTGVTMGEKEQVLLTLHVTPKDAQYTATWKSEDTDVATVQGKDGRCIVSSVSEGRTAVDVEVIMGEETHNFKCDVIVDGYFPSIVFNEVGIFDLDTVPYEYHIKNDSIDTIVNCMSVQYGMISDEMSFNAEGAVIGKGILFIMNTAFEVDSQYIYSLAPYEFTENAFDENGKIKPYRITTASFDKDIYADLYTKMFTAATEEELPNFADYKYYGDNDSYMINIIPEGEHVFQVDAGYPVRGNIFIYEHPTDPYLYSIPEYNIEAKVLGERYNFGFDYELKTDENGDTIADFVDRDGDGTYDLAPITDFNFVKELPEEEVTAVASNVKANGIKRSSIMKVVSINRMKNIALLSKYNFYNRK